MKDLSQLKITDKVQKCLAIKRKEVLKRINFAANNKIIIEIIKTDKVPESGASNRSTPKYLIWRFIDVYKEKVILEIDNMYKTFSSLNLQDGLEIRFIGLLVNENEFNNCNIEDEEDEIFRDNSSCEDEPKKVSFKMMR